MASSSRSIYRHFSTTIARAQSAEPTYPGLTGLRGVLGGVGERITERENTAVAARALRAATEQSTPEETIGRKQFSQHAFLTPDQLSRESLYAPQSPRPRPPLLGPKTRDARKIDPFHISKTSPLDYVFNPTIGQAFVNKVGWIKSRAETGLTWKSQRAVGKLVRRQRAMGIIGQWTGKPVAGGFGDGGDVAAYRSIQARRLVD